MPRRSEVLDFVLVPTAAGVQELPRFRLTSSKSGAEWFEQLHRPRYVFVQ